MIIRTDDILLSSILDAYLEGYKSSEELIIVAEYYMINMNSFVLSHIFIVSWLLNYKLLK
jgi:hypothetical protein